jgi:hypothetical protein
MPAQVVQLAEEIWADARESARFSMNSEAGVYKIARMISRVQLGLKDETAKQQEVVKKLRKRITELRRIVRLYMGDADRRCPACLVEPKAVHARGCKVGAVMSERWTIRTPPKPITSDLDKEQPTTAQSGPLSTDGDAARCAAESTDQPGAQTTSNLLSAQPGSPEPSNSAPTA